MVQVVLSLEKDSEERLRELAKEVYGGKKGALSRVVEDALSLLDREAKRKRGFARLLAAAERARDVGVGTFRRDEGYA